MQKCVVVFVEGLHHSDHQLDCPLHSLISIKVVVVVIEILKIEILMIEILTIGYNTLSCPSR